MVNFIFCIHNHQPVGNFDFVMEKAYADSYYPFLKAVSLYPNLKLSYHITGFLLDWIEEHHPEFIELLKKKPRNMYSVSKNYPKTLRARVFSFT